MALQITGKLERISDVKSIPSKNGGEPFLTRTIILDTTRIDPYTGERGIENHPSFDLNGKSVDLVNSFKAGDVVTISFTVEGILLNKGGDEKQFNRLRCYKIDRYSSHVSKPKAQAAPAPESNPQEEEDVIPF